MNEELLPNLLTWMLEYIKELQQQVKDLEQKLEKPTVVDKKEYNKRFTNRKYLKKPVPVTVTLEQVKDAAKRVSKK